MIFLQSGGYALYSIPLFWHLHEEPRDFYRYTRYGIRHLFEKVGFEIIEIDPLSGFWVTFGSELNDYITSLARGPLRYFIKPRTAIDDLLFLALNRANRKLHKRTEQ